MGLAGKGNNKLSSTNIAEILEAQIEAIKNINDVIVKGKVDQAMLKNVVDTVKPISETIKALNTITKEMSMLKIGGPIATLKFRFAVRSLVDNIQYISLRLGNIWVDPKSAKSILVLKTIVKSLAEMTADMRTIAASGPIILLIKPIINKIITMMIQLSIKLNTIGTIGVAGSVGAAIMGQMLGIMAKGLLVFVLATLGGLVPLTAIVSLLALKTFVWIFLKLFGPKTQMKIMVADVTIAAMAKTIIILSLTVLMWALMGQLIIESWKEILITIGFVMLAILVFTFLGEMIGLIKVGQVSVKQISMTLLMLSLTVLLWALMGDLIIEEWKSILVTVAFVILAIGVFTLLGWAMKFIDGGNKSMLKMSLTLIMLSLTVLLWALMGELITEEWAYILLVGVFVGLAIGLMFVLGKAGKSIQEGGKQVLLLAVALGVLSLDIFIMAAAGKVLQDNWLAILLVGIFIAIVIGICAALTFAAAFIEPGIAILKGIAIALLIVSASFLVFALAMKLFNEETVSNMKNLFLALVEVMTLMGLASVFIALGSAALIILGAALLVFSPAMLIYALALKVFQSINVTEEEVKLPILAAKWIVDAINDSFGLKGMIKIGMAITKVMMLLPVVIALGVIASVIQQIASLTIPTEFDKDGKATAFQKMTTEDFVEAAANAAAMTSILANLFGETAFTVTVGGKKIKIAPITQAALENITGQTMIKMMLLSVVVQAIGNMAGTLANLASLIVPDEEKGFDQEGKPLGWRKMTPDDFITASENIAIIAITLLWGLTEYKSSALGGQTVAEAIEDLSMKAIAKMAIVFDVIGKLSNLVTVVQMMAQMNIPTAWDKEGKPIAFRSITDDERKAAIANTIALMTEVLSAISSPELAKSLAKMKGRAVDNFATIMDSMSGVKDLMDAIKTGSEMDEKVIAQGIGSIHTAITAYLKVLNDLFVGESQFVWKKGWLNIPYPSIEIIKEPEVTEKELKAAKKGLESIVESINSTTPIIENLKTLSGTAQECNPTIIADVIKNYISALYGDENGNGGIKVGGDVPRQNGQLKFIIAQQERLSKINTGVLQKNTDNFIRFIDKANSVDVEKITSIRDMFEQIAEFSKSVQGDFDKLADVLSEKLVVILEKLHGTLEGMNNGEPGGEGGTVETPATGENGTPAEADKAKDDKQKQQEKNLKDIKNALEEITNVLRGVRENTENFTSRY